MPYAFYAYFMFALKVIFC